ncbi:unnamed protein product [marine sediment metagenome]|uniref:Uncharacterized protein n=1 Tax=marine sediment metagenome TaxID=412755 RepID=X1G6X2_9ZZZZ
MVSQADDEGAVGFANPPHHFGELRAGEGRVPLVVAHYGEGKDGGRVQVLDGGEVGDGEGGEGGDWYYRISKIRRRKNNK